MHIVAWQFCFLKHPVWLSRYGELQGLNKQETAERFGKEQVHEWRRSYDTPPPKGESLEMCAERAITYFKDQVTICLRRVVERGIIYLDDLNLFSCCL